MAVGKIFGGWWIVLAVAAYALAVEPDCTGEVTGYIIRKEDCTGWYVCVHGTAYEQTCPGDSVYSTLIHTCVYRGGEWDDCSGNEEETPDQCAELPDGKIIPDVEDCTGWSMCSNGITVTMPGCGEGLVFSRSESTCVYEGTTFDDCTQTVQERCDQGASLLPHPGECQLYYDCSKLEEWWQEMHLAECPYPEQFNSNTMSCDDFTNVNCGSKDDVKEFCKYRANTCTSEMYCYPPCHVENPSCVGLSDGNDIYEYREWSSYYATCFQERLVSTGQCSDEEQTLLFHAILKECVPLDKIPQEHYGTMPDCTGLADGKHVDDQERCGQYTLCEDGIAVDTVKCPDDLVFDSATLTCVTFELSCSPSPCGDPSTCEDL